MNSLVDAFKNYILTNHLFQKNDHLLLAVSGGLDSVVLCELCFRAGFDFSIAHCNFQLREEESDADERFVQSIAEKYAVPFFVEKFETAKYAAENKRSIQVAARELRYQWFHELIRQSGGRMVYLLTAHHADDNVETITMNFFKGSGINGLKGILPKQHKIIRPLLFATKAELSAFAKQAQLSHREDSSNSSNKYTRNYFRNELLPAVEKVFPQAKQNLLQNAERFKDIYTVYQSAIKKIKSKLVVAKENEWHIPVLKLQLTEAMPTVLYEIIKDFDFTAHQTDEVIKLLGSESGKYIQSETHRILRNRKWLIISPLKNDEAHTQVIEAADYCVYFSDSKLITEATAKPATISKNPDLVQLDAKNIIFPLLVRKWKTGDYFYPLGMAKKKKVSRFLTDLKLSLNQKQDVWVVESNKRIIWVIGHRIDDRFKITDATETVISFWLPC